MMEDSIMVYVEVPEGMRGNKIHDISVDYASRENVMFCGVK
jgi:hypothetical protein